MTIEEAILEKLRRLSPDGQEEVLRFAEGLQRGKGSKPAVARDRSREMKWVAENRSAFLNQWVAVEGERLIASGMDALKVFEAATANGIEVPFVVHLVPEESLPFVPGW